MQCLPMKPLAPVTNTRMRGSFSLDGMILLVQAWRLNLLSAEFPFSTESDPKRHGNQLQIQQETLPFDVQEVISEFVSSWNISGRIDLCNSCKARSNGMPLVEP